MVLPWLQQVPAGEGGFLFHLDGGFAVGVVTVGIFVQSTHVRFSTGFGVPMAVGDCDIKEARRIDSDQAADIANALDRAAGITIETLPV